jgi:protein-tyrosine phosphatase
MNKRILRSESAIAILVLALSMLLLACGEKPAAPPGAEARQVVLDGANNFRDLGGYATRDGRHVKTGVLYRADSLAKLSDADLQRLGALHLRSVYDFRSPEEVRLAPDRLPAGANYVALPIGTPELNIAALRDDILAGRLDKVQLPDSYADIALDHAATYRQWFADLLNPAQAPAVFHCTGGKDRTGLAAALFLYALDVPRETIMQDYLATNYYTHDYIESTLWKARVASYFRVDGDRFRTLMGARAGYLDKTFAAIIARYGSIDNYLQQALGLDAAAREQLRALYLQ